MMLSIIQFGPDDYGLYVGGCRFAYPRYPKGQSRNNGSPVGTPLAARGPLWHVEEWKRKFEENPLRRTN